jgi:hypothetical protein
MAEYTYNDRKNIRTSYSVEVVYSTDNGYIGRLPDVQYKQSNGSWVSVGSRWLINESDPQAIMDLGFKSAKL